MWRKYIGARIRGSFINIVAVISLSRLMRIPDPWIFKCQPGSTGSDNVLAPRNIICHPIAAPLRRRRRRRRPLRRRPSSIRKKEEIQGELFPARVDLSIADLFIPTWLNDSITDRTRSQIQSRSLHRKCLWHSFLLLLARVVTHSRMAPFFDVSTFCNVRLFKDVFGPYFVHDSFTLYC